MHRFDQGSTRIEAVYFLDPVLLTGARPGDGHLDSW